MPPPLLRPPATDLLNAWTAESIPKRRIRGRHTQAKPRGLRFAFYGRMSTAEYQDHASSRQWQHDSAGHLVAGRGRIAVSFFDVGLSRSLPWVQRPQAAALLAAASRPDRMFDAIVIGEYERAFAGSQLQRTRGEPDARERARPVRRAGTRRPTAETLHGVSSPTQHMELDRHGAELLFQVLAEREEKASVAIASKESFSR